MLRPSYMLQITMDNRFCKKKSIDPSVTPMPGCSRNSNKPKPWSPFLKLVSTWSPSSFGGIKFIIPIKQARSAKSSEGEVLAQLLAGRWVSRVGVGHGLATDRHPLTF